MVDGVDEKINFDVITDPFSIKEQKQLIIWALTHFVLSIIFITELDAEKYVAVNKHNNFNYLWTHS